MRSRFWRGCRIGFRWCRISALLLILAAVCVLFYFNHVGLPAFLKQPLLASLKERGIQLEFTRMRLRLVRGIVAENVRVGAAANPDSPTLSVGEVQLLLNFSRLLRGQWEVEGLELRQGRLVVPVVGAGQAPTSLELTNIQTDLRFQTNDTWSLDNFQAGFKGATLDLSGDILHASELANWNLFQANKTGPSVRLQNQLQSVSEIMGKIKLEGAPRLTLNIEGDARNLDSFAIHLQVLAPATRTPWFNARNLQFNATLSALAIYPASQILPGIWSNLQPYRLAWSTHFTQMRAQTVTADEVKASGFWRDPDCTVDVQLKNATQQLQVPWFGVQNLQFSGRLTLPASLPTNAPLPGFWSNLQPYQLAWSTRLAGFKSEPLEVAAASAGGVWQSPQLAVTNLNVRLGGGWLQAGVKFDAARQCLIFTNASKFDLGAVAALLPKITRERLAMVAWTQPPSIHASGAMDLSNWPRLDEIPVVVAGSVAVTNATISGVDLDRVATDFAYSNQVWQVTDFQLARQKSRLRLDASEDESTKTFISQIQGAFDLNQIRPWLKSPTAIREIGRLTFHDPLALDVTVCGQLHNAETLAVSGRLALTNFAARGGAVDTLTTGLSYSNRVVDFIHPEATRANGTQVVKADQITLNLNEERLYFTNGYSTAEPQVLADSIGPKTGHTLEPYEFLEPPTARVNGYVSLGSSEGSSDMLPEDLQVDILKGSAFRWIKFNSRRIEGTAHWYGGTLLLTNLNAEFYQGAATGWAWFDFRPRVGTDFNFAFDITNANLHWLLVDLASPTNRLEGLLAGRLVVTSGNSTNWQLMNGYGRASLRDGLIWDAPMFGILSPALNAVDPGLGSSRATDAAGTFTMTNGVVYSDNLEIHSTLMRLQYAGTVDLHENLNARATARPLRDTWGIGPIIGLALWPMSKLFEYKVTGTLEDPKMTQLHELPRLLLAPLHPIKTLEEILPTGNTNSPGSFTNAPPRK